MTRVGDHTDYTQESSAKNFQSQDLPDSNVNNSTISDNCNEVNLAILNCCSVTNKQAGLETFLLINKIDILIGTESHLDGSILNVPMLKYSQGTMIPTGKIEIYMVEGVFILVKDTISSSQISIDSPLEIVWVRLHLRNNNDLIVGSFYCPPNSPPTLLDNLSSSIADIKSKYLHSKILLGGDFNCPGIDWEHGTLTESYLSHSFREKLLEFVQDFQLDQLVTFPTRGMNILDLFLTTHPSIVLTCKPSPGLSDHDAVLIKLSPLLHPTK